MPTVVSAEVLPSEVVQLVLQHVPLSDRVGQCGFVCSSWRTAAGAATTTIDVEVKANSSLPSWLDEHGQSLEHLTLAGNPKSSVRYHRASYNPRVTLGIPFKQLAKLRSLGLTSLAVEDHSTSAAAGGATVWPLAGAGAAAAAAAESSSQAPNSLAALTNLTSLQLTDVHVCLTPLSALSSLQQLEIANVTDREGAVNTALQCALQQLLQLTRLQIRLDGLGDAALAPMQQLQQLQQLTLKYGAGRGNTRVTAASFAALPSSLTCLEVEGYHDRPIVFSSSSTPGLCQLTGLQQLQLTWQRVEPAVLSSLQRLRHLNLYCCKLVCGAAGTAVLLGVLPKLTQLQHLDLTSTLPDWDPEDLAADAAAYAALTASTQLTHLNLTECGLAPGACKHMFREGRKLAMQSLTLNIREDLDLQEVGQTLSCLPVLTDLRLDGSQLGLPLDDPLEEAAALQLPGLLQKLGSQSAGLTRLALVCLPVTADALSQLAQLTGLRDVMIVAPVSPQEVLTLAPLKQLQALNVYALVTETGEYDYDLVNTADEGSPSNLWQHALDEWRELGWLELQQ